MIELESQLALLAQSRGDQIDAFDLGDLSTAMAPAAPVEEERLGHLRTARRRRRVVAALVSVAALSALVAVALVRSNGSTISTAKVGSARSVECGSYGNGGELFLTVNATSDQIAGVRAALERTVNVSRIRFVDQEAAYDRFKCLFADDPDLVRNVDPAALPVSYRFRITDATSMQLEELGRLLGVDSVVAPTGDAECYSSTAPSTCDSVATDAARRLGYPTDGLALPPGWELSTGGQPGSTLQVSPSATPVDLSLTLTWTPNGVPATDGDTTRRFVLTAHPAMPESTDAACSFPPTTFDTLTKDEVPGCATFGELSGSLNDGIAQGTARWQRDGVEYSGTSLGIRKANFARILQSLG